MNFKRLLVPLDGSELSASVLPVARTFGSRLGAQLRLVTADPVTTALGSPSAAAAYLDKSADELRTYGIAVETNVRTGHPARAIVAWAAETHADAILMATHGRSGLRRGLMGSVADEVVQHSSVPVPLLLHPVHPRPPRLQTFVVPLDGSARAAVALTVAAPLAQAVQARLILARVEEDRQAAEAYTEQFAKRLRCVGLDATGVGVSGLPAPALVELIRDVDADLIVMGTHARTVSLRTVLGSVSDQVVRTSGTPVLLVRTPAH